MDNNEKRQALEWKGQTKRRRTWTVGRIVKLLLAGILLSAVIRFIIVAAPPLIHILFGVPGK